MTREWRDLSIPLYGAKRIRVSTLTLFVFTHSFLEFRNLFERKMNSGGMKKEETAFFSVSNQLVVVDLPSKTAVRPLLGLR